MTNNGLSAALIFEVENFDGFFISLVVLAVILNEKNVNMSG